MKKAAFTTQMSKSLIVEYAQLIEKLDDREEKENINYRQGIF